MGRDSAEVRLVALTSLAGALGQPRTSGSCPPTTEVSHVAVIRAATGKAARTATTLKRLRAEAPFLTIVVHLPDVPEQILLSVARRCGLYGADAVVGSTALTVEELRRALPDASTALDEVRTFMPAMVTVPRSVAWNDLWAFCETDIPCSRSMREGLLRTGLPSPKRWRQLRRCLPVALDIQGGARSIDRAAMQWGFHDGATFSRMCREVWGRRPAVLRWTMGWRPLVAVWLDRHHYPRVSMRGLPSTGLAG